MITINTQLSIQSLISFQYESNVDITDLLDIKLKLVHTNIFVLSFVHDLTQSTVLVTFTIYVHAKLSYYQAIDINVNEMSLLRYIVKMS